VLATEISLLFLFYNSISAIVLPRFNFIRVIVSDPSPEVSTLSMYFEIQRHERACHRFVQQQHYVSIANPLHHDCRTTFQEIWPPSPQLWPLKDTDHDIPAILHPQQALSANTMGTTMVHILTAGCAQPVSGEP
jgi:hypothetical protein